MRMKIVGDGTLFGTKLLDADTGEDIAAKLNIRNVAWIHENCAAPFVRFDMCPGAVEVEIITAPPRPSPSS